MGKLYREKLPSRFDPGCVVELLYNWNPAANAGQFRGYCNGKLVIENYCSFDEFVEVENGYSN